MYSQKSMVYTHKQPWHRRGLFLCVAAFIFFVALLQSSWPDRLCRSKLYASMNSPNTAWDGKTTKPKEGYAPAEREMQPYGSGAALFVLYGAYRGGADTFAVVGLGSKPLYVYGNPQFECYWQAPATVKHTPPMIKSKSVQKLLPDVGYGRVYTVVVVNCTFDEPVGVDTGGELVVLASKGSATGGDAVMAEAPVRIVALTESRNSYNASSYSPPYRYDFLYCGSTLFGDLNPERMREWIAYHVHLFGPKSHFIFHDSGSIRANRRLQEVLVPWVKLGYLSIQDVSDEAKFDGYYHNQFLIVNDCLHRTKFWANWTFFFDVDEYMYVAPGVNFHELMQSHQRLTSVEFNQHRMSDGLCHISNDSDHASDRWGIERLVYRDVVEDYVKGAPKYAVQARSVFATGVHRSQKELGHMDGEEGWAWSNQIRYYHYHNTINKHEPICTNYTSSSNITLNDILYELDTSMVSKASIVKQFEEVMLRNH